MLQLTRSPLKMFLTGEPPWLVCAPVYQHALATLTGKFLGIALRHTGMQPSSVFSMIRRVGSNQADAAVAIAGTL